MLHYYAINFFNPILITSEIKEKGNVDVFIVSDLLHDIPEVHFNISVYSWTSFHPRLTKSFVITVVSSIYNGLFSANIFAT